MNDRQASLYWSIFSSFRRHSLRIRICVFQKVPQRGIVSSQVFQLSFRDAKAAVYFDIDQASIFKVFLQNFGLKT